MKTMKYISVLIVFLAVSLGAKAQPMGWEVVPLDFENSATFTWQVEFETAEVVEASDYMAAFVGGEVRGVVAALYHPVFEVYFFPLLVYSDEATEDGVTFRYYDASRDAYFDVVQNDVDPATTEFSFVQDQANGSFLSPLRCSINDRSDQSITFSALGEVTFGDDPFDIVATADSGLPVAFASSDESVATISGNTVTIVGAGVANITASQPGDINFNAADEVTHVLTVNKASQTLEFTTLTAVDFGSATFQLTATASSGLAVAYTSSEQTVATVDGDLVTVIAPGTTTIEATQAGDDNYFAAAAVQQTLVVNKAPQAILFEALPAKTFGDGPFDLAATGGDSGNDVVFSSSNEAVATIDGATVTILSAGEATISAKQAGDDNYLDAPTAQQVLTVNKGGQAINFGPLSTVTFGDEPFELTASGGASDNPVTYASDNESVATVSGSTVTIVGAGTALITASQAGNALYGAADAVSQTLTVEKADQVIEIEPITSKLISDSNIEVVATVDTGLELDLEVTGPATITGNTITLNGASGIVEVTASQQGNGNFKAASVTTTFEVIDPTKDDQTISFDEISDKVYGDGAFALSATASSGLGVTYRVVSGPAAVAGNEVTLLGAGVVMVEASQGGDDVYNPAPSVQQDFNVQQVTLTVTANDQSKTYGDDNPELSFTYSGFVNGDDSTSLRTLPVASTIADKTSSAGDYAITLAGGEDQNYLFEYVEGTLSVAKAVLQITADDQTMTYGEAMALSLTYSGWVNGDSEEDLETPPTSPAGNTNHGVGMHEITLEGGSDENYTLELVSGNLEIMPATLVISADTIRTTYGSLFPTFTLTYAGFVNGDSERDITPPTAITTAKQGDAPGVFPITLQDGQSENYTLTYQDGVLEIGKATLTVLAVNDTITYGENIPEPQLSYSGFSGSDSEETLDVIPEAVILAGPSSDAGFYVIEVSGGASALYAFDLRTGVFVIEKALATISVSNLRQPANGGQKEPTITTTPPDLPLRITYDGGSTAPSEAGEYTVEIEVTDPNYQGRVSFTLFLEQALSTELPDELAFRVYPNPASDWIHVDGLTRVVQLGIFTTEGKVVATHDLDAINNRVPVHSLKSGVYLITWDNPSRGWSALRRIVIR